MITQIGRQAALHRLQQVHKPSGRWGLPGAGAPSSALLAAPAALPRSLVVGGWEEGDGFAQLPPPSSATLGNLSWGEFGKKRAASTHGVLQRMLPEAGEGNCSPDTCKTLPRATGG